MIISRNTAVVSKQVRPLLRSGGLLSIVRSRRCISSSENLPDRDLVNVRPRFDLKGKNFVVTGGGRGIGYAITRAISEMGGNVAVLDVLQEPVGDFNNLEKEFGVKTRYIHTDVSQESSLDQAFDETVNEFGVLHGCVPAAGIVLEKPFVDQTWKEMQRIFDVNINGVFYASQLAAKQMIKTGTGGSIAMIASVCAHIAVPGQHLAAYHASKGAVRMLAKALAAELAPYQIRTNSISPGYIETDMTRTQRIQRPELVEQMQTKPPLQRIGNRNDLTPAIIYLLSDGSAYTTGIDIPIDGGLCAGRIYS